MLGNETLLNINVDWISGSRLALITNNSGVLSDGTMLIDAISSVQGIEVVKVFSPEHGFRGDDRNDDYIDEKTGLRIVTLYGNKKKPTQSDLSNVDILIYDIQDVGARFYTYINTMFYCIEAAVENNKEIIICDRPVIPDANYIDGFMLEPEYSSFVGMLKLPEVYGMTCGELALYINDIYFEGQANLRVSEMLNYSREMSYESLKLTWIKPSPNIYYPSSAVTYGGTCLLEGTNFSEGRGTDKPFEYVGAPWCNGDELKAELDNFGFQGVEFEAITFFPSSITSPSNPPKYVGERCEGVFINVTNQKLFEPVKTGIALLISVAKLYPEFSFTKKNFIDKLAGTDKLRLMISAGFTLDEIVAAYEQELNRFKKIRNGYLKY
jgi:Uncharacterized protein conserved in bacteria